MKITNKTGLPASIVNAISKQYHKRGDYSITELLAPTQQIILRRKYESQIEQDASDMIWMLLGSSIHAVLEAGADLNALTEEFLSVDIDGRNITGRPDFYDGSVIQDYKLTSAWTLVYDSKAAEHEAQLNCYAYMYREHGFKVERLQIVYVLRDWTRNKAKADLAYPQNNVVIKDMPIWSDIKCQQFMSDRLKRLTMAEQGQMAECTAEEQWRTQDQWAVMKEGRKSAVRVFDNENDARALCTEGGKAYEIIYRQGVAKRCEEYCMVRDFCNQYKKEAGK